MVRNQEQKAEQTGARMYCSTMPGMTTENTRQEGANDVKRVSNEHNTREEHIRGSR